MLIFELKCTSVKLILLPHGEKNSLTFYDHKYGIEFSFAEHHMYYLDDIVFLSLAEERKSHAYISYSSEIDNS